MRRIVVPENIKGEDQDQAENRFTRWRQTTSYGQRRERTIPLELKNLTAFLKRRPGLRVLHWLYIPRRRRVMVLQELGLVPWKLRRIVTLGRGVSSGLGTARARWHYRSMFAKLCGGKDRMVVGGRCRLPLSRTQEPNEHCESDHEYRGEVRICRGRNSQNRRWCCSDPYSGESRLVSRAS